MYFLAYKMAENLRITIPEDMHKLMIDELKSYGYKYISKIRKSLFGVIALVEDVNGEIVAVKVSYKNRIISGYAYDDPFIECDYMEILKHENIIECINTINTEMALYIFMPFYEHGDLFDVLKEGHIFTKEEIYVIMKQIVNALIYIDSQNLTYLDLSLENIIVESIGSEENPEEWKIRIIDLGSISNKLTFFEDIKESKSIPGKSQYRSPDIISFMRSSIPFDIFESYVYSLGILLYILFVRYPPYYKPLSTDMWYTHIISGEWINLDFMEKLKSKTSHDLYLKVPREELELINSCIKYQKKRITMKEFMRAIN